MKKAKKRSPVYTPGRPNTRKGVLRAVLQCHRDKAMVYNANSLFAEPLPKTTVASWLRNPTWRKAVALAVILLMSMPLLAEAGTSCTTRKSGSVSITSCSDSGHRSNMRTCRSYRSGSVTKTNCS